MTHKSAVDSYLEDRKVLAGGFEQIVSSTNEEYDNVNSPSHYTNGELEVIDILQDQLTPEQFEGFLKGNILKYTFREGLKNGTEDMKKAAWYTARLIDFKERQV